MTSVLCSAQNIVIDYPVYRSIYDTAMNTPLQVEWILTKSDIGQAKRSPSWRFVSDNQAIVATHDDYTLSGYHRGHMCPAADRSKSQMYMKQTFRMSNIAPQTPAINVGSWFHTESYVRAKLKEFDSIDVVVMPVFLNRDTTYIGDNRIAVPHAFFKSAWVHGRDSVLGCWFIFNR